MKFELIPLIALLVSQIIKVAIYFKKHPFTFKKFIYQSFWVGKFPSTHSAMIASSLYSVCKYSTDKSLIIFAFVMSVLMVYSLLEDKKRHQILESYLSKSHNTDLKRMADGDLLDDFDGHSITEIVAGALVGLLVAIILDVYWI